MRTAMLASIFALLFAIAAVGQERSASPRCNPLLYSAPADPKEIVAGCSHWIESGKLNKGQEASARLLRLIYRTQGTPPISDAEVIDEANRIIELDSRNLDAHLFRIESLRKLGQHEHALRDATALFELFPNDTTALRVRSGIYSELGDHDRAISEAKAAIKLVPRDQAAYHTLVSASIAAGRAEEALADIDSGLALAKSAWMHALRSRVLRTTGRLEEASAAYEAAMRLIQNDDEFKARMKQLSGEP